MSSPVLLSLVLLSTLRCAAAGEKGDLAQAAIDLASAQAEAAVEAAGDGQDNHLTDNCADPDESAGNLKSEATLLDWDRVGPTLCVCRPLHEMSEAFRMNFWTAHQAKVGIVCLKVQGITERMKLMLRDKYNLNRNWLSYKHVLEVAEAAGYQIKPGSVKSEWGWQNEAQDVELTLEPEDEDFPSALLEDTHADTSTGRVRRGRRHTVVGASAERLYEDAEQRAPYLPVPSRATGIFAVGAAVVATAGALMVFKRARSWPGVGDPHRLPISDAHSGDEATDPDEAGGAAA